MVSFNGFIHLKRLVGSTSLMAFGILVSFNDFIHLKRLVGSTSLMAFGISFQTLAPTCEKSSFESSYCGLVSGDHFFYEFRILRSEFSS